MADIPRLNGVIRALESGKPAFTSFCQADPETAIAMAAAKYDGVVFEMEHNPWDIRALRDSLQYMLNRAQIVKAASPAPGVTPMVRIPPNGSEKAQFHAKQALDLGVYGIVWPHISSIEEAVSATKAVLGSKSIHEAFEFQTDYAKSAFEAYVGELSKITELATSATKDSFAPFKGRVQAWLDTVQSVRAA